MTDKEDKRIKEFNESLPCEIEIHMVSSGDEQGEAMQAFCSRLSALAPKVKVVYEEDPDHGQSAIRILDNVKYHAVPGGTELEPFLGALAVLGGRSPVTKPWIEERLQSFKAAAHFKLYVTPDCPHCPVSANDLISLAVLCPNIRLSVIDATLFSDMAQADAVQSAPAIILDDRLRWGGSTYFKQVVEVLTSSDPAALSAGAVESLLHEGGATQVARLMMEIRKPIPALTDLLVHENWSVRLAAMVVLEELIEKETPLAAACLGPLGKRLHELEHQVKGDIIDLAGEIGGNDWIPLLNDFIKQEDGTDLIEAAREAVETILSRNG